MKKVGSVDWTVGKLLAIVLVVVLLIIVVFGWSSAVKPLIERTNGSFNEVLIFFHKLFGKDEVSDVECSSFSDVKIEGVGSGKMRICRGYCEIELEEKSLFFNSDKFRLDSKGSISSLGKNTLSEDVWEPQSHLITDVSRVGEYRDIYGKIKENLESVLGGSLKSVMSFNPANVLEFKWTEMVEGERGNEPVEHSIFWDGSEWKDNHNRVIAKQDVYNSIWDAYKKYNVSWGYRGSGVGEAIKEEMYQAYLQRGFSEKDSFNLFIGDLRQEWIKKFLSYKEGEKKIEELNIGDYPLRISKRTISGRDVSFVFVTLNSGDVVGVYYKDEEFCFYSKKYEEKYNEDFMELSDGSWEEVVKLNEMYKYLRKEWGC